MLAVALGGVVGGLAITGGPDDCTPGGGPITVSDALSDAFQQKWDEFDAKLDGGSPASVTFNESEVTSRAVNWINNEDGPDFDDAQVCIHDGYGEATGTLRGWGPFDVKFMVRGTVELVGDSLFTVIEDVDVGNVPDGLTSWFESQADGPIEEGLDNLGLEPHTYTIILTEGSATVEGQP
jgi:hypothetical protein